MMRNAIAGTLLVLVACRSDGGTAEETPVAPAAKSGGGALEGATQVVWRYDDSSVPPEYHRSYVITVTPASIRKVVDSYGKVLGDETLPFDQARFDRVLAAIARHQLTARAPGVIAAGCSGGNSHAIEVKAGDRVLLAGNQDHCGGEDGGSLSGDTRAFDAELAKVAPTVAETMEPPPTTVNPP